MELQYPDTEDFNCMELQYPDTEEFDCAELQYPDSEEPNCMELQYPDTEEFKCMEVAYRSAHTGWPPVAPHLREAVNIPGNATATHQPTAVHNSVATRFGEFEGGLNLEFTNSPFTPLDKLDGLGNLDLPEWAIVFPQ